MFVSSLSQATIWLNISSVQRFYLKIFSIFPPDRPRQMGYMGNDHYDKTRTELLRCVNK